MRLDVATKEGIAHVVLDDPPLNILTRGLLARLRGALETLRKDGAIRVLVVSAEGRHFSAGASVEEHLPEQCDEMIPEFVETVLAVDRFPAPVIFAVQGRCLGGALELALAGDMLVSAENALFGVPEIQLGVLPPAACVQLPGLVSAGVAAELVYTGSPMSADDARRAGLVLRVVPTDQLLDRAMELAQAIAAHSASSLRVAKKAMRAGRGDLEARMTAVSDIYLHDLMATTDATEGLASFMEKREPEWSHS